MSFIGRLRAQVRTMEARAREDPWEPILRTLKGRIGRDGVERISTHEVFDHLEVPMKARQGRMHRLSRVMRKLGWSNVRARGLNRGSYRDRVRGFARCLSSFSWAG
jgi:hypothetical protein